MQQLEREREASVSRLTGRHKHATGLESRRGLQKLEWGIMDSGSDGCMARQQGSQLSRKRDPDGMRMDLT